LKRSKRYLRVIILVIALIFTAIVCRIIGYETNAFFSRMLNFVRTFIYIGLIASWGVSVNRRVVQSQIRLILNWVSVIMVLWLTVREFKFRFISDPTVIRYLWYSYYIPIIIIPVLALFVSLSLGKSEKYRLPKSSLLLFVPSGILIFLVLTNDFHQLVFRFPDAAYVWTETDYAYGSVFVIAAVWCVILSVTALVLMLIKSRWIKNSFIKWLPIIPIIIGTLNTLIYALKIPFASRVTGDIAVLFCLAIAGFFEGCIQVGLIQTNTRYFDLFVASKDISAQIVDKNYNVVFSASEAQPIDKELMRKAQGGPVVLENGRLLHSLSVNGGFAVWTEDISQLLSVKESLSDRKEELEERNALLQLEYKREKEHKTVEEQNRLYDLLQSKTQSQLNRINELVREYKDADTDERKHRILSYIVVLGSFIKRRKDFALSYDYSSQISESMLTSALGESFRALRLLNIKGEYFVETGEKATGEQLTAAYDFFEDATESVMETAEYINARVCFIGENLRVSVLTDVPPKFEHIKEKYSLSRLVNLDEDGYMLLLDLGGGVSGD